MRLPRYDYTWYGSPASREQLVKGLRYLEPTADLRTTYQYQNLMYTTAGYLVGGLTGSSWEEQLRLRILEPLGMASTTASVDQLQASEHAARPHEEYRGRVREVPFRSLDALAPAGAINSSVSDMLRWLRLQLGGGRFEGKRLISKRSFRAMHTPRMPTGDDDGTGDFQLSCYGLGWTVMSYRGPSEHPFREHRRVPVPGGAGARGRDRDRGAQQRLAEYAGDYRHPAYGRLAVRSDGQSLTAALNLLEGRLKHFHYDVFEFRQRRLVPLRVGFHADADGRITSLSAPLQEGVVDIVFTRDAKDRPA